MSSASSYPAYYPSHGPHASASSIDTTHRNRPASSWSAEDDASLINARQQGLNWQVISSEIFPSKTANACRKRHERLMERNSTDEWDNIKLHVLAATYFELRQQMWSIMAKRLNEKWSVLEAKCMGQGLKNLTTAARSAGRRSSGTDDDSGIGLEDAEQGLDLGSHGQSSASASATAMGHDHAHPPAFYSHAPPHQHAHAPPDSYVAAQHHHPLHNLQATGTARPAYSGPTIASLLAPPTGPAQ